MANGFSVVNIPIAVVAYGAEVRQGYKVGTDPQGRSIFFWGVQYNLTFISDGGPLANIKTSEYLYGTSSYVWAFGSSSDLDVGGWLSVDGPYTDDNGKVWSGLDRAAVARYVTARLLANGKPESFTQDQAFYFYSSALNQRPRNQRVASNNPQGGYLIPQSGFIIRGTHGIDVPYFFVARTAAVPPGGDIVIPGLKAGWIDAAASTSYKILGS